MLASPFSQTLLLFEPYHPLMESLVNCSPGNWTAKNFVDPTSYTIDMSTEQHVLEMENALQMFKEAGPDGPDISPANFHLPTLGPILKQAALEIHYGRGFVVINGPDPAKMSNDDWILMYLGISSYIGEDRGIQDIGYNMLVHIRHDAEWKSGTGPVRHSNKESRYHQDHATDIIGLYIRKKAMSGGESVLSSVETVVQKLSIHYPDVLDTLMNENWPRELKGPHSPIDSRPILYQIDGRYIMDMSLSNREIQKLSKKQKQAVVTLNRVANECHIEVSVKEGSMFFMNNRGLLHGRKEFQNDSNLEITGENLGRHYVRLHLRNKAYQWSLPQKIRDLRRAIFEEHARSDERWAVWDSEAGEFKVDIYDGLDSH